MNFLLRLIWQLPSRDFMRGKRKAFFIKVQGVPATFPEWRHTVDTNSQNTTYSRKYQTFFWYRDLIQMEIWVLYQGMTSIYGMLKNPWAATKKRCRLLLCLHVVSFPIDLVLNTDAVQDRRWRKKVMNFPCGQISHRFLHPLTNCIRRIMLRWRNWQKIWKALLVLMAFCFNFWNLSLLHSPLTESVPPLMLTPLEW